MGAHRGQQDSSVRVFQTYLSEKVHIADSGRQGCLMRCISFINSRSGGSPASGAERGSMKINELVHLP